MGSNALFKYRLHTPYDVEGVEEDLFLFDIYLLTLALCIIKQEYM